MPLGSEAEELIGDDGAAEKRSRAEAMAFRPFVHTSYVGPSLADCAHEIVRRDEVLLVDGDDYDCDDGGGDGWSRSPRDERRGKTGGTLYLGPLRAVTGGKDSFRVLRAAGVTGIVSCIEEGTNIDNHQSNSEGEATIEFCHIPISDCQRSDISVYFDGATSFVHERLSRGDSVLVHCNMGVSRSATIVIAYLMKYMDKTRDDAYIFCKARRPMVRPNDGFWNQLHLYEERLADERGEDGADRSVKFDYDWARRSFFFWSTSGHLRPNVWESFPEISYGSSSSSSDVREIWTAALDYVFGRGVARGDLDWLRGLYESLQFYNLEPGPVLESIVLEEGSECLLEKWAGDVDREQIIFIFETLVTGDLKRVVREAAAQAILEVDDSFAGYRWARNNNIYMSQEKLVNILHNKQGGCGKDSVLILDVRNEDGAGGRIVGARHRSDHCMRDVERLADVAMECFEHGGDTVVLHCMESLRRAPRCARRLERTFFHLQNRREGGGAPMATMTGTMSTKFIRHLWKQTVPNVRVLEGGANQWIRKFWNTDLVEDYIDGLWGYEEFGGTSSEFGRNHVLYEAPCDGLSEMYAKEVDAVEESAQ